MSTGRRRPSDDGSTLPEVLVAGALVVVALTMVAGTVLAPVSATVRATEPDPIASELDAAAGSVARLVRAASPSADGPAVERLADGLVVRLGEGRGSVSVRITSDGRLLLQHDGVAGASSHLPADLVVTGLDVGRSSLELLDGDGSSDAGGWDVPSAVRVVLHAEGREATRTVGLRGARQP